MIKAAIIGGTGYGGMELLRWLIDHPEVEVGAVTSRRHSGRVDAVHDHLRGFTDLEFSAAAPADLAREHDVVFFATPHSVAAEGASDVLDRGCRVIDLSGDHRLADAEAYTTHYGKTHAHPERLGTAAYGLPECGFRSQIIDAQLVANPGCHATATLLALWPLVSAGLVAGRISVVSVTGSSGSGSEPRAGTHHPERFGNYKAYRPLNHQHLPEIVAALGGQAAVDFVPHSAPFARGIHVTAFVPLLPGAEERVAPVLSAAYGDEPFVRIVDGAPEVRSVVGTNLADVGVEVGDRIAVVMVTIDNLGKGMAGQAVQNLNAMFGLDETTGLFRPGGGL